MFPYIGPFLHKILPRLANRLIIRPQIFNPRLLPKRRKVLLLHIPHLLPTALHRLASFGHVLLRIGRLFFQLGKRLFRGFYQGDLLLELFLGVFEIALGVLLLVPKIANGVPQILRLGGVAAAAPSGLRVQIFPFHFQRILFGTQLLQFMITKPSGLIVIFLRDTSRHGTRLADHRTPQRDSLNTLLSPASPPAATPLEANLPRHIQRIANNRIPHRVQHRTSVRLVAHPNHVGRQSIPLIVLGHGAQTFGGFGGGDLEGV
mmetsp:Transcript_36392/g.66871  ORF Transcript_36392/g.66871 Transcript_36392/m.66871 type:complete len:261 (+) Transcript_36392:1537-2319(+)